MFVHCVYFWLKPDLTPAERDAFTQGVQNLLRIPDIKNGWVGKPAATSREVIDSSYDWALVVAFEDEKGHDAYQVHPLHDVFRENCHTFWTQVKIYDFNS